MVRSGGDVRLEGALWSTRIGTVRTRFGSADGPGPTVAGTIAGGGNPAVPASTAPERYVDATSTGSSSRRANCSAERSAKGPLAGFALAVVPTGVTLVGELSARMIGVGPDGAALKTVR